MKFVLIPAGEFYMGSLSVDNKWYRNEKSVHKVNIKYPFYLGKYLVTQKQWVNLMGKNPSKFIGHDRPVEKVSWDDIQNFIEKLNEMEDTAKYRLPSEAEWEYACRAGTSTRYSFGNDESKLNKYGYYGSLNFGAQPVGQK